MHRLPNNCRCSEINVIPKNWKRSSNVKKDWIIYYRFYDPVLSPKGKMFQYKAGNHYKNPDDRRQCVEILLYEIKDQLFNKGFNPVSSTIQPPNYNDWEVDPYTPFIPALKIALNKVKAVKNTLIDMASVVKGVEKSAVALQIDQMPISKVTRKYIKQILEHLATHNKKYDAVTKKKQPYWSANRHNRYRTYLICIFKELLEMEAIEVNPVREISKMKQTLKEKVLLTSEQKSLINETVYQVNRPFWKVLQIFFHSGSRITELVEVRKTDVDLLRQRCRYTVRKGPSIREIWRPIKDVALPFWQELYEAAKENDYIISEGMAPGPKKIRPEQISRRWTRIVKKKLGINVGFYLLKHLNSTEMMDELSRAPVINPAEDVARLNGHTGTSMLRKVYDVRYADRESEKLRKVGNRFE